VEIEAEHLCYLESFEPLQAPIFLGSVTCVYFLFLLCILALYSQGKVYWEKQCRAGFLRMLCLRC